MGVGEVRPLEDRVSRHTIVMIEVVYKELCHLVQYTCRSLVAFKPVKTSAAYFLFYNSMQNV